MTKRDKFLGYVRNGGDIFCSPQIGGGAGFDTRLAGKEWVSGTNLSDTMTVIEQFDILPLLNVGLCDLGECNPALAWKEKVTKDKDRITREYFLNMPKGGTWMFSLSMTSLMSSSLFLMAMVSHESRLPTTTSLLSAQQTTRPALRV